MTRLRKIARLSALIGVVPFSEQADIVPNGQQAFEEAARVVVPAEKDKVVRKPGAARQTRGFARREPVGVGDRLVAGHETGMRELSLESLNCPRGPSTIIFACAVKPSHS